jgi:hypothetical protein
MNNKLPERLTLSTVNEYAQDIGDALGVDWNVVSLAEFTRGLAVELEHGSRDPETNITNDSPLATGKIALAHLYELNDYYTRLDAMENAK